MVKTIKLKLIRRADWIDVHILDHKFPSICNALANSDWWGEPVNLDDLTLEQAIEEVNKPYPNIKFGKIRTAEKMRQYLPESK